MFLISLLEAYIYNNFRFLSAAVLDFPLPVTFDSNGSIGSRSNEFAELENMRVFIEILTASDLQDEILVAPV